MKAATKDKSALPPRQGKIHLGTSGWVYPHWKGSFYPRELSPRHWLEYYSKHFNAVEINASFYRLPSRANVRLWQTIAGKSFLFCPKMSRFVTHAKKLNDPEQAVPRFFKVFGITGEGLGPVLLQIPQVLPFHEDKAVAFFSYLREHFSRIHFSLEGRHPSWFAPAVTDLLRRYRIGWVIADAGNRFTTPHLVTSRDIYVRFHGPDGRFSTSYPKTTLRRYAGLCREWASSGYAVWIFFNNDIGGHAPRNALALKELIG